MKLQAFKALKRSPGKTVLVEKQIDGVCHRLLVVDGELLYAVETATHRGLRKWSVIN